MRHMPNLDFFHEQRKLNINSIIYGFYGQFSLIMKKIQIDIKTRSVRLRKERKTCNWLDLFQSITNLSKQILEKYFNKSEQNYEKKVPTFHIEFIISIFTAKKFIKT